MKTLAFFIACFILSWTSPRPITTEVYYNKTEDVSDGEIWGSNLYLFFIKDSNVIRFKVNSHELNKELINIKEYFKNERNLLEYDDYPYDYAFVTHSRDTLYTNDSFSVWRYKKRRINKVNKLNKYLSLNKR